MRNQFKLSADRKTSYYDRDNALWAAPAEGGTERKLAALETGGSIVAGATPTGVYVFVNADTNKPGDLMFYRLPSGPLTKVVGAEAVSQYGWSISPDGKSMIYAKQVSTGADLMLVENFE